MRFIDLTHPLVDRAPAIRGAATAMLRAAATVLEQHQLVPVKGYLE